MRLAVPLWNACVSPVLDTAERLLVVDIQSGQVVSQREIRLDGKNVEQNAQIIADHADILVCGALSRMLSSYFDSRGIAIYPWIMGEVDTIIQIFNDGKIPGPEFSMPGCRRNHRGWHCRGGRFAAGGKECVPGRGAAVVPERKGWNQ